jgi:hypothetical protein
MNRKIMPITVKPTQADLAIAREVVRYTNERTEKAADVITWARKVSSLSGPHRRSVLRATERPDDSGSLGRPEVIGSLPEPAF